LATGSASATELCVNQRKMRMADAFQPDWERAAALSRAVGPANALIRAQHLQVGGRIVVPPPQLSAKESEGGQEDEH